MSEHKSSGHWESLAEKLGAEPRQASPKPQTTINVTKIRRELVSSPRASKPATDWSSLAKDLGLPPLSVAPPSAEARPKPAPPPVAEAKPTPAPPPVAEPIEPPRQAVHGDQMDVAAAEPLAPEATGAQRERHDRDGDGRGRRRRGRGRGRRDRERGDRGRAGQEPSNRGPSNREDENPLEAPQPQTEGELDIAPPALESEDGGPARESERPFRDGRRRRRGRRGRGERGERGERAADQGERTNGPPAAPAPSELQEDAMEAFESEELPLAEDLGDDLVEDAGEEEGLVKTHKAIPSWQETVSVIITANMDSRARNPNAGRGPRGRGR